MNQIRALLSFQSNPLARHIAQPEDLSVFVKDGKPPAEGKVSDDALLKSLSMSRSAQQQIRLMNGPPGTGKTSFLGHFIQQTIKEHINIPTAPKNPYKLLVCAPTKQSLDVLLRKIWKKLKNMDEIKPFDGEAVSHQKNIVNGVQIVRVGEEANERLEEFLLSTVLARKKKQGAKLGDADLRTKILQQADIVGCTLKDCGSKIVRESLEGNVFALIVDDACHCLETELLLALQCKTKRVFLVGDREQEIIHIRSKEAKELGFGRSMLARIAQKFAMEDQNTCIHNWDTQYRMEAEIAKYPSSVMYLHKLKTEKKQTPFFLRPYIIFDVSDGKESMQGESVINKAEALFIKELHAHVVCSLPDDKELTVGVITHSDGQRDLLKRRLEGQKIHKTLVGTPIDFFGLEKDVIILCCTRTGGTPDDHGFLMNKQVLNLVLTRANFSLIIVGNMARMKEFANWKYLVDDATGRKLVFRTSQATYREDAQNCRERYSQASTYRKGSESHTPRTEFRGSAARHQQRLGQPGHSLTKSVGRSSPGDQSRLGTGGRSPLTGSEVQVLPGYQQTWSWNGLSPTTESEASQRREQAGPSNGMELVYESRHNPRHEGNPAYGNSQDPMEEEALFSEGSNPMIEEQVQHNRKGIVVDQTRAVEVPCHGQEENRRSIQVSVDDNKVYRGKRRVSFNTDTEDHQRPAKVPRTKDSAQETSSQMNSSTRSDYPQTSRGSSQPRGILKKPHETISATSHSNGLSTDQDKPSNTNIPQRQRGNGSSYIPNHGSDDGKNLHEIAVGLGNNERISRKGKGITIRGRTFGKFRPQRSRRKDNDLRSKIRPSGEDADAGIARSHQDLHSNSGQYHSHGSNRQQEGVDQYPQPLSHSDQSLYERPENRRSERRHSSESPNVGTFQSRLGPHENRRDRSLRRNNNQQQGRSEERLQRQSRQEPPPERHLQRLESLNRHATNPVQLNPTMEHHRLVNQASGGRSTELTAPLPNVRRRNSCNPVKDSQMDYQD
ncbi:regulator of nonsense transcripts 1 homolog [Lytechinus pictus]|uniref:regulator of nonsense transcripts 1 homolog n=1 Tax=Lytechinus pictus TaxID=7653 RepID=UPI0030B9BF8A